ncbi:MAG: Mov34/MPN/PAD-1 family protein [archaeon]
MWKIKSSVINSIIELAKNAYPNEFSALLVCSKDNKVIDDIYILPATQNFKDSSFLRTDLSPMSLSIIGSVHSHPNNSNLPSNADLKFFSSKDINVIICNPFGISNIAFYNSKGAPVTLDFI